MSNHLLALSKSNLLFLLSKERASTIVLTPSHNKGKIHIIGKTRKNRNFQIFNFFKSNTHLGRDGNGAGLGRAPLSHTRPKIFNYFPSPSQTRNGAGSSFPSPIRMPLKIPYPLRPAPPRPAQVRVWVRVRVPYTIYISNKQKIILRIGKSHNTNYALQE